MLKILIKAIVKNYIRLGFFFYYKKIDVSGLENIPEDKPVFFLPNHHNALIDPLLIATTINGFASYLTRANVFKKPLIAKILDFFGLLPIYRMRDGYGSLGKNQEIFDQCMLIFEKNEKLLAFPEANHNIQRRVRKLSKGFTRIVFQVLEENPDTELQLIPIGFNYVEADAFPDSVSIIFGEPISVQKYRSENLKELTEHLRSNVQSEIAKLTTNIPLANYQEIQTKLDEDNVDYLDPLAVNEYIKNEFKEYRGKYAKRSSGFKQIFKAILIVNILLPYAVWKYVIKPKVKEREFMATFRFTLAVTLVPLYLLVVFFILSAIFGLSLSLSYLLFVLIVALLAVKI